MFYLSLTSGSFLEHPVMNAEIIPFPYRIAPVRVTALVPLDPGTVAAAGRLAGALKDQHRALLAWQTSLDHLTASLHKLAHNLRALEGSLAGPEFIH